MSSTDLLVECISMLNKFKFIQNIMASPSAHSYLCLHIIFSDLLGHIYKVLKSTTLMYQFYPQKCGLCRGM